MENENLNYVSNNQTLKKMTELGLNIFGIFYFLVIFEFLKTEK